MEQIEGSETSAIRTKTPGNYPKENVLHIEHGKSLKSRIIPAVSLTMHCTAKIIKNVCDVHEIYDSVLCMTYLVIYTRILFSFFCGNHFSLTDWTAGNRNLLSRI
jgi:hypothetical protein